MPVLIPLLNKVADWRPANIRERDLCFPVNFAKFSSTPF